MRKSKILIGFSLLFLAIVINYSPAWASPSSWPEDTPTLSPSDSNNLLVNGNMEELPFYWQYPNHYVAGGWNRWWIDGTTLPEYDDVRPGRYYRYDGYHAQIYFKWGNTYTAGIFQVVDGLTQCTPYSLSAWARNHSLDQALPHAKIGLDPTGSEVTPDGAVKNGLPPFTAWSEEQTALFTWEELTVEAEPLGDSLSVILYASPQPGSTDTHYYDTFWDTATLTPTNFPDNRLPEPANWDPSGFIQNVTTKWVLDELIITWTTPEPASTQVWYEIQPYSDQQSAAENGTQSTLAPPTEYATDLDTTPTTEHRVVIKDLKTGDEVRYVALSRRPQESACVSEVSEVQTYQLPKPTDRLPPNEWKASGFLQNVTISTTKKLYISWDTPEPASTQVWYNIEAAPPPPTSTFTIIVMYRAYLPLMIEPTSFKTNYEYATPLDITPQTHHTAVIDNVQTGDIVEFVALSCHNVNEECVVEVSSAQREEIIETK